MYRLLRSKRLHTTSRKSTIDFNLQVKDFGPVREADISIKPLTILIGPNRSGKSQLAMLTHTLISSYNKISEPNQRCARKLFRRLYKIIETKAGKSTSGKKDKITIAASDMGKIKKTYFDNLFKDVLPKELQYYFSADLDQLTRFGAESFVLKFNRSEDFSVNQQKNKCVVRVSPTRGINIVFKAEETSPSNKNTDENDNETYKITLNEKRSYARMFELERILETEMKQGIPGTSYYFPAARSGILQAHRTVAAGLIKNAGRTAISGMQAPQTSGIVNDFVSDMIDIVPFKGMYYEIGEELEQGILDGHIMLSKSSASIPEIEYKLGVHKIPIHRTSSSISETAPLTLFLKYIVVKDDLLIIEEPEAHLDPANQLVLARYLVKMVRAGLNIMMTTHSALILEQISNFLQANKIDKATKTKLKFNDDEYLTEDEIAPYLLTELPDGGYKSHLIEFSEKDGISQEEFMKIEEELTRQTWHIEKGMPKEE